MHHEGTKTTKTAKTMKKINLHLFPFVFFVPSW
jgi:hypothetical protein